ncbi:MAG: hypothetical protein WAJ87_16265, partial [Bryobacteraceae bacterium]
RMLNAMSAVFIFICSGLLVYWFPRTLMLLFASEEAIAEGLDCDLWWGRRVLSGIRSAFVAPQQFIG